MVIYIIMLLNKLQLNQLQSGLCYILTRDILTQLVLTLSFINQKNANLFLLKLLYLRKVTLLLDVFRNIHHTCSFNDHYLNRLLDNLSKGANKIIVLLGDFNIDLLNFDTSEQIITFLYDLNSNSLQLQILLPNRISKNSETLIDNVFCNILSPLIKSTISGNISSIMSDHLPHFFTIPDFSSNSPPTIITCF